MSKERRNRSEIFRDELASSAAIRIKWRQWWEQLHGRKLEGFKFRRQHPIGSYIANFYCAEASLVVELDGMTHDGRKEYDAKRQSWLESQGLLVVRIRNQEFREWYHTFFEARARQCAERIKNK